MSLQSCLAPKIGAQFTTDGLLRHGRVNNCFSPSVQNENLRTECGGHQAICVLPTSNEPPIFNHHEFWSSRPFSRVLSTDNPNSNPISEKNVSNLFWDYVADRIKRNVHLHTVTQTRKNKWTVTQRMYRPHSGDVKSTLSESKPQHHWG